MSRNTRQQRSRLLCEAFESRIVPTVFPIPANAVAISPDDGGIPQVKIVDPTTGADIGTFQAFEDSFRGGVHVALGDVTGDGVRDMVIAAGKGGSPRIRIVDGKSGVTLNDFFVYEQQFTGGINVSIGDTNGDGVNDIIVGTGAGGGPRVRVLDGKTLGNTVLKDFFAYEDSFRGGVLVSSGDTNGDGKDDIITGTGPGGGPVVRVLSGADGRELSSMFVDDPSFRGGVRVDSRDVNGDGRDDIIAHVRHGNDDGFRVFDGTNSKFLNSVSRVVDDNPSATDTVANSKGVVTAGVASSIEGTFVSVDTVANTVTIKLQNGTNAIAKAGAGTEIKRDKLNTTLATFRAGDKVEALVGPDGIAWEIEAKSAAFVEGRSGKGGSGNSGNAAVSVEGTIAAISATANTVTVRDRAGQLTTVQSGVGTKIERNNATATLASLVIGDSVEAKISANGIAIQIEAVAVTTPPVVPPTVPPAPSGTTNAAANSKIEGRITAIDVAGNSVTIRVQSGTSFIVRAVATTKIERNDNHTSLAAFQVGDFGEAEVGSDGFATKIEAVQV